MTLDELLALAARDGDGHVFGAPLAPSALERWQQQNVRHPLPLDLQEPRQWHPPLGQPRDRTRHEGLAPLEEWALARHTMWGADANPSFLGDEYLAISYHTDGSAYWVLKTTTGEYHPDGRVRGRRNADRTKCRRAARLVLVPAHAAGVRPSTAPG